MKCAAAIAAMAQIVPDATLTPGAAPIATQGCVLRLLVSYRTLAGQMRVGSGL